MTGVWTWMQHCVEWTQPASSMLLLPSPLCSNTVFFCGARTLLQLMMDLAMPMCSKALFRF
jgi:hypothetical protein